MYLPSLPLIQLQLNFVSNVCCDCWMGSYLLTRNWVLKTNFKTLTTNVCPHRQHPPPPPTSNTSLTDELKLLLCWLWSCKRRSTHQSWAPTWRPATLINQWGVLLPERVNAHKVSGPDGLAGRVLRVCTEQLADVFTHIFKLYLVQPVVLTYYKTVTIVPVPKHYNFALRK